MSRALQILIAESPKPSLVPRAEVRAVPGSGLRTFAQNSQKPDFEITLIESENIQAFAAESGLPFTARDARRNIVTEGIARNDLIGVDFRVGDALIRGIRLCQPRNYLAKISYPETLKGLVHKGGLRAQILAEGEIHIGDRIQTSKLHNLKTQKP